ncbi:MAG: hypothetical protein KF886_01015 [Candidatus Hydrogenedentes bacterium]|nr:hypothetical protein [Candidatus Hydrogenedentota bacterium]
MEQREDGTPVALHDRAMENLSFIRDAMERSEPFTGISGKGLIAMGLLALAGGHAARLHRSPDWWIYTWLAVAVLGCVAGLATMCWKMRNLDRPSVARATRRFALNVAPAVLAGVFLTEIFYELGLNALMPGLWLLLYGTGVVAGGALSVRIIPAMGGYLMILGAVALFWTQWGEQPFARANPVGEIAMVLGFGGGHIVTGAIIWRRYGG